MMTDKDIRRLVIKIGSNVLTRRDGRLDITRLSAIVDQVAELRRRGIDVILISSGAVASGRGRIGGKIDVALDDVSQRQLFSAVGQAWLINRYYELFRDHELVCGQVLTTKENFATRRHYLNQKHCMEVMLRCGDIPVVNENDTVSVTELMFTDNDELSGLIATMMDADALVILSNIDGLYTGDPADPASRLIPRIMPDDDMSQYITSSKSSAGRGGMATKYRIARKVASEGIAVVIANGKRDNILPRLVDGDPEAGSTTFVASDRRQTGVKKWIAHSESFAKGTLTVNDGAREALLSRDGASLLAVGVTAVEGDFEKDDIVIVADSRGETVAWGRVAFDAQTARDMMGRGGEKPLVHADYLYIDDSRVFQ